MRILSISAGADTAGQGHALMHGFRAHSDVEFRSVTFGDNYLRYPADWNWHRDRAAILAYAEGADVILAHNNFDGARWVDPSLACGQVIWHHGTMFREAPGRYLAQARRYGALSAASTLDLTLVGPDVAWLPVAVDAAEIARHRRTRRRGPIRIGHAPTNRAVKSTDAFLAAASRLAERHAIEVVLLEGLPWAECLPLKGTLDVLYDQVILGYGLNAVEAWAMGIPVVAGADPATLRRMRDEFGGDLPFMVADVDTIEATLQALILDATLRDEYAERGRAHVARFHDDEQVVRRAEVLARVAATTPRPPIEERLAGELVRVPGYRPGAYLKVTPREAAAMGFA